jgi:hypothetical protein
MVLRLVLVGLVAGLGGRLPGAKDLEAWARSAQGWMDAQLVARDAGMPAAEGLSAITIKAAEPGPITTGPADDPDRGFDAILDEILAAFAEEPLPARTVTPRAGAVTDAPGKSPDADRAFAAVVEEMAARFATARVGIGERDGRSRPGPRFEPLEVGEDLYPGVAYALNREAEGSGLSAPREDRGVAPAVRGAQFTRALRLTREALSAWASLLQGPAVVAIAH